MTILYWSLWGQRFGEYRDANRVGRGLLYRKAWSCEGWLACGFTDPVEIFYLDPYP